MPLLHDALRPDSPRRWGRMSVGQMLCPRPLMKFIVINLPWPKGAPTQFGG
jgi:hypothetical protein